MQWVRRSSVMVAVISMFSAGIVWADKETEVEVEVRGEQGEEREYEYEGEAKGEIEREAYTPELRRVSELDGMKVVTESGEELGKIEDLIVDVDHGLIAYAVVTHGGILGIGDKDVLVPFAAFHGKRASEQLRAKVTMEQFKQSEGFDEDNLDEVRRLSDAEFAERFHRQFEKRPYWERRGPEKQMREGETRSREPARERERAGEAEGRREAATEERREAGEERMTRRGPGQMVVVSTLLDGNGVDIKTKAGVDVGDLKDLMVDLHGGHIGYAIVDREDELVPENKLCAVPWELLRMRRGEVRPDLTVDLPVAKITKAPGFPDGHWPEMAKLDWNEQINTYYDSTPYYVVYGYVRAEPGDERDLRFTQGETETLKGTIQQIDRGTEGQIEKERAEGEHKREWASPMKVRLALTGDRAGETVTVKLAPSTYLREKGLSLQQGQDITVTGWKSGDQIVAQRVEAGGKSVDLRDRNGQPQWKSEAR